MRQMLKWRKVEGGYRAEKSGHEYGIITFPFVSKGAYEVFGSSDPDATEFEIRVGRARSLAAAKALAEEHFMETHPLEALSEVAESGRRKGMRARRNAGTRSIKVYSGRVWIGPGRSFWSTKLRPHSPYDQMDQEFVKEIEVPDYIADLVAEVKSTADERRVLGWLSELGLVEPGRGAEWGTMRNPTKVPRRNPKKDDTYDPKMEQIRAQRQAIYETTICRELGKKEFRDRYGKRADAKLDPEFIRSLVSRMFAIGTGVPRRDSRLSNGSSPTAKAIAESKARYEDVDRLIRNRQDYEETLSLGRKSGFYRILPEMTRRGVQLFIWPMPPGTRLPILAQTERGAKETVYELNETADPRSTGRWWKPPAETYTKSELGYWLPPASVWK